MNSRFFLLVILAFATSRILAETVDLPGAIDRALQNDPRISELQYFVEHARALKKEAEGNRSLQVSANTFLGFSPALEGGIFRNECGNGQTCELRRDRYKILDSGLSPWWYLQLGVIKPLNTFGKIENFIVAAENNIRLKEQDVRLQRGDTIVNVKQAYYGYLAARNSHLFLDDVASRIESALETAQINLEEERGDVTQADIYALESALGLANSYVRKATALETVAIEGLKVLLGLDLSAPLELADKNLKPVPMPETTLEDLKQTAMESRPEVLQLRHGLQARKALVKANKAMKKPNVYAGFVGSVSYSPLRDRVDNPHIYDPFNDIGATPVIGVKWDWEIGVQNARVQQAQAELSALMEKKRFAQRGIPYEVSEAYARAKAQFASLQDLKKSAKAARRWMISRYTDYQAGLVPVDKLISAFQAYVMSYTDYLQTVYGYNMQVAQLQKASGDYQ